MIMDSLSAKAKKSPVCLGLDTKLSYLPQSLLNKSISNGEKIYEFNRAVIDATAGKVSCFKVQIAYYEALGLEGMTAYSKTLGYIRKKGEIVIADVKRGDITATAEQYAKAHFSGDFEADIVTVNAFMGEDALSPYYDYLGEKGLFVLVKTSNPSGADFQNQKTGSKTLYELTAEKVFLWGQKFIGESGFSAVGAVVGCTYPDEFNAIKALMPHTFFLIPGYGAQGGRGEDIAKFFRGGVCGVVNSSRGLITAHKGKSEGGDFVDFIAQAVDNMNEDIFKWL